MAKNKNEVLLDAQSSMKIHTNHSRIFVVKV